MSHRGVLLLADLGEFLPVIVDALCRPLEDGFIRVSRGQTTVTFPARILLVATMKPCPCGQLYAPSDSCTCTRQARLRYAGRVFGPLLDRFHLRVAIVPQGDAARPKVGEPIHVVAARVAKARQRAAERGIHTNSELPADRVDVEAPLNRAAKVQLERAISTGRLTGRGAQTARLVALTIADLAGDEPPLTSNHIAAALALRVPLPLVV